MHRLPALPRGRALITVPSTWAASKGLPPVDNHTAKKLSQDITLQLLCSLKSKLFPTVGNRTERY